MIVRTTPARRRLTCLLLLSTFGLCAAAAAQTLQPSQSAVRSTSPIYANGFSDGPLSVSDDGRFVLFTSAATNLVPVGNNNGGNLFLLDSADGHFERIETHLGSTISLAYSGDAAVSDDGRYVLFNSRADFANGESSFAKGGSPALQQVYRYDRQTGNTILLSVDMQGNAGDKDSFANDLSGDGRYAVFSSAATNMAGGNSSGSVQIYRYDASTQQMQLVSASASGQPGIWSSERAEITPDGRYAVFDSASPNLVPGFPRGTFLRDMDNAVTTPVSVSNDGASLSHSYMRGAFLPSCSNRTISSDGRYIVFSTFADADPADNDHEPDIYLRDRLTQTTRWVSDGIGGVSPLEWNECASISNDGLKVAYSSRNGRLASIFVRDLAADVLTEAASALWGELESIGAPTLSGDGASLFHTTIEVPDTTMRQLARTRQDTGLVVLTQLPDVIFAGTFE